MAAARNVRVIPAGIPFGYRFDQPRRSCAYVRVSTSHEAQMGSLKNQAEYYERLITGIPGYAFAGIYSDAGISGSREDRPGFLAMMEAARAGQLDLILTKSISRFARNTELLLSAIRELKSLGVGVLFEENKINTLSASGELLLSILASFAEEERRSVSRNIQWSIRAGYQKGKPSDAIHRLYGYTKGKDGRIETDLKQAAVIVRIYKMYLAGATPPVIAAAFNNERIPRDRGQSWNAQSILRILGNERYAGDCLLQKSFVADSGRQVRNKGQLNQYYVREHHSAIVSREIWDAAQRLREARRTKQYPLTSMLRCSLCRASLIRVTQGKTNITWVCATCLHHGKSACPGTRLPDGIAQAFHEMNPITQPMIVKEATDARNARPRTAEHYCFSPLPAEKGQ